MSKSTTIERIQRLAAERGWSSVQLAAAAGVSQRTAYNVLRGRTDTTTAKAEAMLAALEAPDGPAGKISKKLPRTP